MDEETVFVDPRTGEEIDPALVQSGKYRKVDPSWGETISSGIKVGLGEVGKAIGGIGESLGETVGIENDLADSARGVIDSYLAPERQTLDSIPKDSWKSTVGTVSQFAPVLGGALLTGPIAGAAGLGALGFGRKYNQLDEMESQGQELPGGKFYPALTAGAVDAVTSLPFIAPAKLARMSMAAKAGTMTGGGAVAGAGASMGDLYSTYMGTGEGYSPEEIQDYVTSGAVSGGVGGGVATAGMAAVGRLKRGLTKEPINNQAALEGQFEALIEQNAQIKQDAPGVKDIAPQIQPEVRTLEQGILPPPQRTFEELVTEVESTFQPKKVNPPKAEEVASLPPEQLQTATEARSILQDETGAIRIPEDISARVKRIFIPEAVPEAPQAEQRVTPLQGFLEGRIGKDFGIKIPGVSNILSSTRKIFTYDGTIAGKFKSIAPAQKAAVDMFDDGNSIAYTMSKRMEPYTKLSPESEKRVGAYLMAATKKAGKGIEFDETPEFLAKQGLSSDEIAAVSSYRDTMDYSLKLYKESLIRYDKMKPEQADELISQMTRQKYVPLVRFGDKYVYATDAKNEPWYSFHESDGDFSKTLRELQKQGYTIKGAGKLQKPAIDSYENISPLIAIRAMQAGLDPNTVKVQDFAELGLPISGFEAHHQRTKFVEGASQNVRRNTAEYLYSLSRDIARKKFDRTTLDMVASFPDKSTEAAWVNKFRSDLFKGGDKKIQRSLQKAASLYYLPNVKTIAVNSLTPVLNTHPQAIAEMGVGGGTKAWIRGTNNGVKYWAGKTLSPDVTDFLLQGTMKGRFADQAIRELSGVKDGQGKGLLDMALFFNAKSEAASRIQAGLVGYEIGRAKGLQHQQAVDFGLDFINKTNYDYTPANRNAIEKHAPVLGIFKHYSGSWLRQLRNNMTKDKWKGAAAQLGYVAAFAGLSGIPGIKEFMAGSSLAGLDLKTEIRKYFGEDNQSDAEAVIYGLPNKVGVNIAGSVGLGELAPGIEEGIDAALAKTILGPIYDLVLARPYRALTQLKEKNEPRLAAETIAPPVVRSMMKAERLNREGGLRTPNVADGKLLQDPTAMEKVLTFLNFTPSRLAREYDARHMHHVLQTKAKDNDNINENVAREIVKGDYTRAQKLISEHIASNAGKSMSEMSMPDIAQIQEKVKANMFPWYGRMKTLPKKARPELQENLKYYEEPSR